MLRHSKSLPSKCDKGRSRSVGTLLTRCQRTRMTTRKVYELKQPPRTVTERFLQNRLLHQRPHIQLQHLCSAALMFVPASDRLISIERFHKAANVLPLACTAVL